MLPEFNSEKKSHQGHRLKNDSCYFYFSTFDLSYLNSCIQNIISKIASEHFWC